MATPIGTERIQIIRQRIANLREAHAMHKADQLTEADLEWWKSTTGLSVLEIFERHQGHIAARCKQIETVVVQLEQELAELNAPHQPKKSKK